LVVCTNYRKTTFWLCNTTGHKGGLENGDDYTIFRNRYFQYGSGSQRYVGRGTSESRMTTGEMAILTNRFNEIKEAALPKPIKNVRFQGLLNDIRTTYESDKFAIQFYYTVLREMM
jgi:hypothetical protein